MGIGLVLQNRDETRRGTSKRSGTQTRKIKSGLSRSANHKMASRRTSFSAKSRFISLNGPFNLIPPKTPSPFWQKDLGDSSFYST